MFFSLSLELSGEMLPFNKKRLIGNEQILNYGQYSLKTEGEKTNFSETILPSSLHAVPEIIR